MKKIKFQLMLVSAVVITLGLSVSLQSLLAAWTAPTALPPNGNIAMPINEGSTNQAKLGGLAVSRLSVTGTSSLTGYVGLGTAGVSTVKLYVYSTLDAAGNNGSGAIVIGNVSGQNIAIDENEIMARNNSTATGLHLNGDGGDVTIHTNAAAATRFVVLNNGNVGIGTTSPAYNLSVAGNINYTGTLYRNGSAVALGGSWNLTGLNLYPTSNTYNVAIGTRSAGTYKLYVNGKSFAVSGYDSSDARLKKNVAGLDGMLDKVGKIRGVSYDWDLENYPGRGLEAGRQIGVIAQELEKEFPELIAVDSQGFKAVAYDKLTAVLIETTKELNAKIDAMQKEIDELKNR